MSEEDALLRTICEHPDDDTPRLVFADWLTEQGGPINIAWANAIRAQIWMARGVTEAAIAQQSRLFESNYGFGKLLARLELPPFMLSDWERGFPRTAVASFDELEELWPRLAFRLPIRKLTVYEVGEVGVAEFATWPALSLLVELEFAGVWETPDHPNAIPILAGCADLRNLKILKLRNVNINDVNVIAILDSPHLVGLDALRLDTHFSTSAISDAVRWRLHDRFGRDVFDGIPF